MADNRPDTAESDRGCTCPINRASQAEYVLCPVHDEHVPVTELPMSDRSPRWRVQAELSRFEQQSSKVKDAEGNLVAYQIDVDSWRMIRAAIGLAVTSVTAPAVPKGASDG